jgi:hypothetical protein
MAQKKSQQQRLMSYFMQYGKITAKQASAKFGTKNLRARINEFRQSGMKIVSQRNPKDKRSVVYVLSGR